MVSILFLIGQGLEPASIIDELLNIQKTPCKPHYEMADDAPLVLWDCIFPSNSTDRPTESQPDSLNWEYVGSEISTQERGVGGIVTGKGMKDTKYGTGGLVPELWKLWRKRKMEEVLAGSLLNVAIDHGNGEQRGIEGHSPENNRAGKGRADGGTETDVPLSERSVEAKRRGKESQKVFLGGDEYKLVGRYVPLMQRKRMESVEVINTRYARKEGLDDK